MLVRDVDLSRDCDAVLRVNREFSTETVFDVRYVDGAFVLRETPRRVTREYPFDFASPGRDHAVVAVVDRAVVGFLATSYQRWNRRLVVEEVFVDSVRRRQGVARAMVDRVLARAGEVGATHLWLETSNVNVPAIRAYQRLGFEFCVLSLYENTPARGEIALHLPRAVGEPPPTRCRF
ncbi:hypothetical protein GCM10012275_18480 [Longimycelium tulufanense]|uniref:N-acetyltransferase domain-containing protein n=2 Tax=Longimycelium tulufanense TaxID=907463 RepID=A0A8J3CCX8_9PSEU|nr:hypothetical protein GCM10012275_18480 [Longimycelium tulufanense]